MRAVRHLVALALMSASPLVSVPFAAASIHQITMGAASVKVQPCVGNAVARPRSYVISCADANSSITAMNWSVWGSVSAKGSGKYTFNTCTPTCVAGRFVNDAAMVTLSTPKTGPHGRVFTKMNVRYRLSAKRQVSLTVGLPLKAFTNSLG